MMHDMKLSPISEIWCRILIKLDLLDENQILELNDKEIVYIHILIYRSINVYPCRVMNVCSSSVCIPWIPLLIMMTCGRRYMSKREPGVTRRGAVLGRGVWLTGPVAFTSIMFDGYDIFSAKQPCVTPWLYCVILEHLNFFPGNSSLWNNELIKLNGLENMLRHIYFPHQICRHILCSCIKVMHNAYSWRN